MQTLDTSKLKAIYYNQQQTIGAFKPNEIDKISYPEEYCQSGIAKECIDIITDFTKINQATYDFGDTELNNQFQKLREETDYNQKIEYLLTDLQVYGNAYTQVVRDENQTTIYNINPDIAFVEYDFHNPQKEPKAVGIKTEKKIKNKKYYLILSYYPGEIIVEAVNDKEESINPLDYFDDVLNGSDVKVRSTDDGDEYYITTNTTYPLMMIARRNKPADSFFGQSVLHLGVQSKIAKLNKMYMLAEKSLTISANPKLQLSQKTTNLIKTAIGELSGSKKIINISDIDSLTKPVEGSLKPQVSLLQSNVVGIVNNKLVFFEDDGMGENKYITSNYSLGDLYEMIRKLENEIRSELYVSQALSSPDTATGAKSGIAYKRLMQKTINHCNNIRATIKPTLQKIALTMLEVENNITIGTLPNIEYPEMIETEENDRVTRLTNAINTPE